MNKKIMEFKESGKNVSIYQSEDGEIRLVTRETVKYTPK